MINLLPPQYKQEIAYGRKNKILLSWLIILSIFLLVLLTITAFGKFYIEQRADSLLRLADISQQRAKSQELVDYQTKAEDFSNDLNTAVKLLEDQLLFSKIITTTGAVLPEGVRLSNLNYSTEDDILSLNIIGNSQQDISRAFTNIKDGQAVTNQLFLKADLVKIDCNVEEGLCNGSVIVLLNKNSEFYLLNRAINNKATNDN